MRYVIPDDLKLVCYHLLDCFWISLICPICSDRGNIDGTMPSCMQSRHDRILTALSVVVQCLAPVACVEVCLSGDPHRVATCVDEV